MSDLTPREREVLALAAGLSTNAEIAKELGISPHTVKTHLSRSYTKLGVSGRRDAVRAARTFMTLGELLEGRLRSLREEDQ